MRMTHPDLPPDQPGMEATEESRPHWEKRGWKVAKPVTKSKKEPSDG